MTNKLRFFFYQNSYKISFYLFLTFFLLQITFWLKNENIKPNYKIIPAPPSQYFLKAASLGDNEFLFRILAFRIQNSGDIFISPAPLKNYNYNDLYQWLTLLDNLNSKSNSMASLAAYYFSQTQNKGDLIYITNYLYEHAIKDLNSNWWWLFQAINIAEEDLKNDELALKLAYKLTEVNSSKAPLWTKQMPAFIYAKQGNGCMAFKIIKKILDENNAGIRQISANEMDFMRYFIKERIKKIENKKFDPRQCQN